MGQFIELTAADGHSFNAYVAAPTGKARGGLVVVQEIFGVNSHVRTMADGFAAAGYLSVAPALFDRVERGVELGYESQDMQRGMALKTACGNPPALRDIAAAVSHAKAAGRVGIVGYCWGGLLAWLAACEVDSLAASVPYYGGGMPDHAARQPRVPVLAHFGERDAHISLAGVEAFAKAQPGVSVHLYAAGHGFNCDQRASFDAAAAALARERTLAFLRQHVG